MIPDSLEITKYMSQLYPALMPSSRRSEIYTLLQRLHSINFFALTYAGKPETQEKAKAFLEGKLGSEISSRYRLAIDHKLKRLVNHVFFCEFNLTVCAHQYCEQQTRTPPKRESDSQ